MYGRAGRPSVGRVIDLGEPMMWGEPHGGASMGEDGRFQLPAGTVTFLLSDIEGSTGLWESSPEAMARAVPETYAILDDAIAAHEGVRPLEQGEGDSVVGAFSRASDAVAAALDAQRRLHAYGWPDGAAVRVRLALHTADAQLRDEGNYFGVALSRAARLRGIAHGGQTLLSRATHDLVVDWLPDGVELVDCGVHRLRDLGRPEQVFAVTHPDLPAAVLPLLSLDAFPNNLPSQLTSFVGRASELAEIGAALAGTRLLTLTGAGGAGKTRLALQAAADDLERYPDGVWWVELAALAEPELVAEQLASTLGVRPLPGATASGACIAQLSERRALVALDNCEHLLDACAELTQALLHSCPQVTVLATSRTRLGVAGETEWRVPSLSLPAVERAREPIAALAQSDAVRLFIDRARKARPNFAASNENAPAIAQICHELDGLPLAIELAAARVRMLTVDQIASGLGDRFHLLTRGTRSALPRQQTLRASVDWSHDLLTEEERVLLRRLAVFAGGFTLDAVEDVCSDDLLERIAILDLLSSLVDKSLVVAEEHGPAVRYRLLETVRQYASERLAEAGESNAVRDRHRNAYLILAERAAPELRATSQLQWLDLLDPEAGNLAAALDWAVQTDSELALRFCAAVNDWWRQRGQLAASERGFSRALDVEPTPSGLRARVLSDHGYLLAFAGKFEEAIAMVQQGLAMAEEVGDDSAHARALNALGFFQMQSDPLGSRPLLERSCELARASGDDWCLLDALLNLAWTYEPMCEQHAEAEQIRAEALPLAERVGYREHISYYWLQESWRPLMRAESERFLDLAERALAASRDIGEPLTEAITHHFIGILELAQGRPEEALAREESSHERQITTGSALALPWTEILLAAARAALGEIEAARSALEDVVASGADGGWSLAAAKAQLADVLRVAGDAPGAEAVAREALELGEHMATPGVVAWAKEILGRLAAARGEWGEAAVLLDDALGTRVERGLLLYLPQTLDALAEVAAGLESHEEASRVLGAVDRTRGDLVLVRWPPDEPQFAELELRLRAELGDEGFQTAHDEGAALSLEDTIAWIRRARGERKRPQRGWEALTPTELKVVELVAEGLTNPQIAERMFISRGTVKVHLSHVFAKVGASTRAELAAEATRRAAR
jgi:predicted ATPase/class 3 adenylate cyclase/DNA-binding CsgD family transcriptional regulator